MNQLLRKINAAGIQRFREFLATLRSHSSTDLPQALLTDPECTEVITPEIRLAHPVFNTKLEAATYLKTALEPMLNADTFRDSGLWTWLSMLYFEEICPIENGRRLPKADAHYILEPANHKRRYRHLLATPVQILFEIPDHHRIYLNAPLTVHGELTEQTMSRLYLVRIPAVREAIDILYFDPATGKAKKGITNKTPKKGDLRSRFAKRIQQLSLTFDIASMSGQQLVESLGNEFRGWHQQQAPEEPA